MKIHTGREDEAALRDFCQQLESAVAELNEAEVLYQQAQNEIAKREQNSISEFRSLAPLDNEAIAAQAASQAELALLKTWVEQCPPMRAAIQHVLELLPNAKPIIQKVVQSRSVEESGIYECHWAQTLGAIQTVILGNQVRRVREVSGAALRDIRTVLSDRRGALLTMEERRDGILRGGATAIRRLSPSEVAAGVADV